MREAVAGHALDWKASLHAGFDSDLISAVLYILLGDVSVVEVDANGTVGVGHRW
jgi:hypothetical protein